MIAIIETVEGKVVSCRLFEDTTEAESVFEGTVSRFGENELTEDLYDDHSGTAHYDDGDVYTIQMIETE